MTAMCRDAIKVKNYYWSYPENPDVAANLLCCTKSGTDEKTCRNNINAAMAAKVHLDFCYLANRAGEPPPKDWNVPADCTGGPCLVTGDYCKSVGYADMDRSTASILIATLKKNMLTYPQSATSTQAILKVCFGVR
jgi:hypothetical protein